MLKVAIDTSPLESAHRFRGVGSYTEKLIETFKTIDTGSIEIEAVNLKKVTPVGYSLIHYPYFEPFFLSLPLRKKLPVVVSIHDLIPLMFPEHFPKGVRGWFKWQLQKFSLKSVARIITDSENSKKDIIKFAKIPAHRVRVIYLAAGGEFKKLKIENVRQSRRFHSLWRTDWKLEIKEKYQLPETFLLYVGDLNWNKNVEGLVKAFYNIKYQKLNIKKGDSFRMTYQNLKMVFIGKAFADKNLKELIGLKKLIRKLKLEKEIVMLGFVPLRDLVAIYNLATVYCQPSFYEGFGLPVLEALACGCPVVCANMASLPEIAGEAAIFVNPREPEDIALKINQVLNFNRKNRRRVVEKSLAQAKKFSWQRTAKETLKVYEEVLYAG